MGRRLITRTTGLMAGAALLATSAVADPQVATPDSALATPDQRAAEAVLLKFLADPAVRAAEADVRRQLQSDPAMASPDGQATLDRAIDEWTASLIMRELADDPAHPIILWATDDTPHSWYGYTAPGMAISGDNPDHIYRDAFLDGAGRYEVDGQIDVDHRPAQFSFELTPGSAASFPLQRQTATHTDMGGQIAMRTDRDLEVDPGGNFRLTIGGPGDGPNHLTMPPGEVSLNVRDVLSDWSQRPNRLTIKRLDPVTTAPLSEDEARGRVLRDLPGFVLFWAHFKDHWLGGIKPNTVVGPVPREGGWGFQAGGRFHLAPGEAVVIKTTSGGGRYNGVQVVDPWMVAADGKQHQTSVNPAQATRDADGGYTYVISAEDPGVANWLDTGGLHDGYVLLRWQGFPVGAAPQGLLRGFQVVKIADIRSGAVSAGPAITAEARQAQLARHALDYAQRQAP